MTGYVLDDRSSITSKDRDSSLHHRIQNSSVHPLYLLTNGEGEVYHSLQFTCTVKNPCTPPLLYSEVLGHRAIYALLFVVRSKVKSKVVPVLN